MRSIALILLIMVLPVLQACSQKGTPVQQRQGTRWGTNLLPNNVQAPLAKKVEASSALITIGNSIAVSGSSSAAPSQALAALQDAFQAKGIAGNATQLKIVVGTVPTPGEVAINGESLNTEPEAFYLDIKASGIELTVNTERGIVHGLTTLEGLVLKSNGKLKQQQITDWPDNDVRAVHIVMKMLGPEVLKSMIDRARTAHFNTIILSLVNSVKLKSLGNLAQPYAITTKEFQEVVQYARDSGLEVIPQISCLSHQDKELIRQEVYPDLMYNERTYDPRKPKVYDIVFAVMDEVIELIDPAAIHIGHDEVVGHNQKQIQQFGPILPANLFLADVLKIHDHLTSKGVRTWMWGDMLIIPSEFPQMHPGSLNAVPSYVAIRDSLPRDIVICDWHYKHYQAKLNQNLQFPTIDLFANMGFDVLGATWNVPEVTQKFSTYVARSAHPQVKGMIATTWSYTLKGATSNSNATDNYQAVEDVFSQSGQAFWNAKK